ncbi:hypothetical protein M8J75_013669 [Diaphorina citri]|nr:hypothetical protein M8J75_013669 [Diaphorina citri]
MSSLKLLLLLVVAHSRNISSTLVLTPNLDLRTFPGYEQCKPSNEVCSVNNDCCSNCCTSHTYSSMTCQDECPEAPKTITNVGNGNAVWKGKQNSNESQPVSASKAGKTNDETHGNVVWKGKLTNDEYQTMTATRKISKTEDRDKVISRPQRENQNFDVTSSTRKSGQSVVNSVSKKYTSNKEKQGNKVYEKKEPILEVGEVIVKNVETKPNKDIGVRIDDPTDVTETVTKTRENIEVGLSVINITKGRKEDDGNENTDKGSPIIKIKDSGENGNTDIGTPIIKVGDSGENENTDIGTPIIKIGDKSKGKNGTKINGEIDATLNSQRGIVSQLTHDVTLRGNGQEFGGKEDEQRNDDDNTYSNKDLGGDVIQIKTPKTDKTEKKDQNLKNLKSYKNNPIEASSTDFSNSGDTSDTQKQTDPFSKRINVTKTIKANTPKSTTTTAAPNPCADAKCESGQSFADGIKDMFIQKLPNLISLNTEQTSQKPVCKSTGSTCEHPGQCCSQCCAVSDGVFQCFDKGTDECQSSLPGATAPKCKKPGEKCETHGECCLNKCTDCGRSSKCDNESETICRSEGKQTATNTKLCKHLGDICGEASECCTQCCAFSEGIFRCFEEGTHECQPGDNVSNTTISEVVEVIG